MLAGGSPAPCPGATHQETVSLMTWCSCSLGALCWSMSSTVTLLLCCRLSSDAVDRACSGAAAAAAAAAA
jgi:hypothetical protein